MNYAGNIHHRYIIWGNIEKREIYILPKYNSIIDNYIEIHTDKITYYNLIHNYPIYWNNYFI